MAFIGPVTLLHRPHSSSTSFKSSWSRDGFVSRQSGPRIAQRYAPKFNIVTPIQMEGNVPINAPSAVLLLSSSVLAIASIGCVFELTSGHPQYGQTITSAVLAFSLPGFLFLFYSAIRKGQQEALDDP